MKGLIFIWR